MNTTANGSNLWVCSSLINASALKIGQTIGYSLILGFSLFGNSIIGLTVYKTPTLRKPINYLIANMAISDMLFPFFTIPLRLAEIHSGGSWPTGGLLGQALCKLAVYLTHVSFGVSSQSLVLIALDRYVAVVFPLRSPFINRKLFPFFILATWVVALAFFAPYMIVAKVDEGTQGTSCYFDWHGTFEESWPIENHYIVVFTAFSFIPAVLLVILYSIILIKLKLQAPPGEQLTNATKQRERKNRNVLRMAIAIVLAFFFCSIPITTTRLITVRQPVDSSIWFSCGFWLFNDLARLIFNTNCAINPLICLIFSNNYRQGLKRLLKC